MKNDIDIKEKTLEVLRQEELQFNSDNGKMEKIEPFSEAEIYKAMQSQQDGDAWLFYQLFRDQLCYDHAGRKWYRWNTHYWKEDEVEEVIKKIDTVVDIYSKEASKWAWRALKAAKEGDGKGRQDAEKKEKQYLKKISVLQKKQWKKDILELAAAGETSLGITGKEWDIDPWLLSCPNGVIELKNGTFSTGKQFDYIKTICPTKWRRLYEPCPTWEKFLNEIFNEDKSYVSFIQRLLGYSIAGLTTDHILPIFWGKGRNGKGTLFDVIYHVLGSLSGPIQAEMLLEQRRLRSSAAPTSDIMAVKGKRIVWASETDEGRRLNAGKVKWLVGGDTLCGREPYAKREINFTPTHTLFLLTNSKPRVDSQDYALWQRIHLIPFILSFVDDPQKPNDRKRDPNLPEKLKTEASGILAWLVRGCLEWQKQGLNPPEIVKNATTAYQQNEDIISQFISERCIIDSMAVVQAGKLYKAYCEEYCQEYNYKPVSQYKFSDYMLNNFKRDDTGRHRTYLGIGLKTSEI